MNFVTSIIVSSLVVICVWCLMIIQPSIAQPFPKPASNVKNKPSEIAKHEPNGNLSNVVKDQLSIDGISKKIVISEVATLWEHFNSNKQLHNRLIKQPGSIYVLYTNFGNNYQSADVTIGYNVSDLKSPIKPTKVRKGKYTRLLKKGTYTYNQITQSWSSIDYQKTPIAVLEIHSLNTDGEVNNTELYVKYEEAK